MTARIAPVLASLLVLGGCLARPADGALEEACKTRLGARLAEWTMASVAPDVAAWAHTQGFDPRVARGDFDGDGRVDVALLVQARATPVLEYPERISASRVAVCFDRSSGLTVQVIDDPYCGDYIRRAPKGGRYHDFETDANGVYPSDGVTTVCFKKASATYVYDGARFRRIVDGD